GLDLVLDLHLVLGLNLVLRPERALEDHLPGRVTELPHFDVVDAARALPCEPLHIDISMTTPIRAEDDRAADGVAAAVRGRKRVRIGGFEALNIGIELIGRVETVDLQ